jgi:molybdate transport system permease protein
MVVDPVSAVRLSLVVGTTATLSVSDRRSRSAGCSPRRLFPGKSIVTTLLLLPLVLPPCGDGLPLLRLFGRATILGGMLARHRPAR